MVRAFACLVYFSSKACVIASLTLNFDVREFYKMAISANSIASVIAYAIEQPPEVETDEIVVRPTAQDF